MKNFFVFFLLFILTIVYAITMDHLTGMNISMAVKNLKYTFSVITFPEYLIMFFLALSLFINPAIYLLKKLKQKDTK
jgi:uncharacterized membrane protein YhaH (DUF805 family)